MIGGNTFMLNPEYFFARMQDLLDEYKPSRERSLVQTKLDEAYLWLTKCERTEEALVKDQSSEHSR